MAIFTMLIGLPGSGKSHYANEYIKTHSGTVVISSDDIRQELWGDANDQQNPSQVFDEMFIRTVDAMQKGTNVIYDATNLVAKTRKATLTRLRQTLGQDFIAVADVIVCSLSECKRRQGERDRKVPDEVIDRMVRQFQTPWYNEGWDTINVISCGKQQNIDREHWRMLGESHDNHHHSLSLEMHCAAVSSGVYDKLKDNIDFSDYGKKMMVEAGFQHDLGKHKTKAFKDSKGNPSAEAHYYSHDNVGAYLWLSGDKQNEWTKEGFLFIAVLIQWHMQPYFLRDKNGDYRANFKEWCDKKGFDLMFYESICLLHEADEAAH
jgi:predicted kinase